MVDLATTTTLATRPELPADFKLGLISEGWDTWVSEPLELNDEDIAWFKEELNLTPEDLGKIFARAKVIVGGLQPNDDLLNLTYDTDLGNWYLDFRRPDPDSNGTWKVYVYRQDEFDPRRIITLSKGE